MRHQPFTQRLICATTPAWSRATTGTTEEKKIKLADPDIRRQMIAEEDMLVTTVQTMCYFCTAVGLLLTFIFAPRR